MRSIDRITMVLLMGMLLAMPVAYATGPGFDDNVYNWHRDKDDGYGWGDDDHHGGGDDDNNHCDDDNWNDDDSYEVPLDGGLGVLAAAGAAYGVFRVRDNKGKKKTK